MRTSILVTVIVAASLGLLLGWLALGYAIIYPDLPPAERAPVVSSEEQTNKTLAVFDSDSQSAFARLYPRESRTDRDQVWDHCAAISANGRINVPVEAASPGHTRVVLHGFSKDDPSNKAGCTFWLTWETGEGAGYWYVSWNGT